MWRKRNPLGLSVGMQTNAATVETVWSFLQKVKTELPYNPVITLLDIYPPKYENTNLNGYMYPYGYYSISYNSQPECPLRDGWIKKKWHIYIQWNIQP